ncbi:hypothetical protein GCM10020219_043190 [Nonomuraea dietziae]
MDIGGGARRTRGGSRRGSAVVRLADDTVIYDLVGGMWSYAWDQCVKRTRAVARGAVDALNGEPHRTAAFLLHASDGSPPGFLLAK